MTSTPEQVAYGSAYSSARRLRAIAGGPHRTCNHKTYRLTCEQYEDLLATTGNCCQICGISGPDTPHGLLHIDHDTRHGYWAVRGLLCSRCNTHFEAKKVRTPEIDRYLANPWFVAMLSQLGIAARATPAPARHCRVIDPARRLWRWGRAYGFEGWLTRGHNIPRHWSYITSRYGPHEIRIIDPTHANGVASQ